MVSSIVTPFAEYVDDPYVSASASTSTTKIQSADVLREWIPVELLHRASSSPLRILLICCDNEITQQVRLEGRQHRWCVEDVSSGSQALNALWAEPSDVVFLGPSLPDLDLSELQNLLKHEFPSTQVFALQPGSNAPVPQSSGLHRLTAQLRDLLRGPAEASVQLPDAADTSDIQSNHVAPKVGWQELIGTTICMQQVYRAAHLVARRNTTVLIQGESGTGKDLLAKAIHASSTRSKQPFVVVNCAAIPETLLEAELFGHTKGAFTGAAQARIGRVHAAHGGTLFLDEIGDMPISLQSKILRLLEQGELQRVGSTENIRVDCRVIAATNAQLKQRMKSHEFREDLYYRLAVFPLDLPPLRERKDDIELLCSEFLRRFSPGSALRPEALSRLMEHNWPGNVRELRNVIERACILADGSREIASQHIVL